MSDEQRFTKGKIVEFGWGYDQTNVDYFLITKRTPKMVILQPIGETRSYDAPSMTGTCIPDCDVLDGDPIRRKVVVFNGEEVGIAIKSYGWADLWDGNPSCYSTYA